jgi:putative peptidoglycan lipid II flippase
VSKTEKTIAAVTFIIVFSNLMGYLREMLLAKYFGASYIIDSYLMAQSIAFILFTGIMSAIGTSFIPLYSTIKVQIGHQESNKFTSGVINMTFLLGAGLTLIGVIFADPIVSVIAYGFSEPAHQLTVHFVRIGFMVASLISINEIAKAYLYCNEGFIFEKIAGLVVNFANILLIVLSAFYDYKWLMYGYLLGYSLNVLLCLNFARIKGFRYKFILPDRATIRRIATLVLPVFIGSTAGQINTLVDKFLASGLSEGSISFLGYAGTVNGALITLFTAALNLIIYPKLSDNIAKSDIQHFKDTLSRGINYLIIILTPITFGAIALAEPGIVVLYQRGHFGAAEVLKTAAVLPYFSVGMLAAGINGLIGKAFYAVQDTKTPMKTGILAIIINIILSLLLIKPMAYLGLALAGSLASILITIPNAVLLKNKIGQLKYKYSLAILIKSAGASLLMSIIAQKAYLITSGFLSGGFFNTLLALLAGVGLGALVYILLMWLFKVKEITEILYNFRNILRP